MLALNLRKNKNQYKNRNITSNFFQYEEWQPDDKVDFNQ